MSRQFDFNRFFMSREPGFGPIAPGDSVTWSDPSVDILVSSPDTLSVSNRAVQIDKR